MSMPGVMWTSDFSGRVVCWWRCVMLGCLRAEILLGIRRRMGSACRLSFVMRLLSLMLLGML